MSYALPATSSRHVSGFAFVILLHGLFVYALVSGLAKHTVQILTAPLETRILSEAPPQDLPPPVKPKLAPPPPPYIPPPEISVRQPAAPMTNAITAVTQTRPAEPPPVITAPVVTAAPVRIAPVISSSSCSKPEYPAVSQRLEETGTVHLAFLVDTDGKVLNGKVEQSSGFPRLDKAALDALSECHFKPGTSDGKPEQSWARINYVWKID